METRARFVVSFLAALCLFILPAGASAGTKKVEILATRHKAAPPGETSRRSVPGGKRMLQATKTPPSAQSAAVIGDLPWRRISAKSVVVMDAATGELLYARAPDDPRQPASTIKVLTAMLALQKLGKNDTVPVSARAAGMPRSKIYLRNGKKYSADDLIHAILLSSANDASVAVAEKIAGSEAAFARLMTDKARALGASNTVCKTASGLTAEGQRTTARDLAIMFQQLMADNRFANILQQRKVTTRNGQTLWSHNRALWQIQGNVGGKTGYTDAARQTYVGKFKRDDGELVIALMGSERMWEDVRNLSTYGFSKMRRVAQEKKKQITADSGAEELRVSNL